MTSTAAENLARQGVRALQQGNAETASTLLTQAISEGFNHPDAFVALGQASRQLDQVDSALRLFTQALIANPRHLRALLAKADMLQSMGREKEAVDLFTTALKVCPDPDAVPADLRAIFMRGFELMNQHHERLVSVLESRFPKLDSLKQRSPRFAEAVNIVLSRARPFYQQPTKFFYPGLPERAVYDRSEFDWAEGLEEQTQAIAEELKGVLAQSDSLQPYLEVEEGAITLRDSELINNLDWGAYYLWKHGAITPEAAAHCPKTIAALESTPLDHLSKQAPSNLFSVLNPGTHIPPHHGMLNTRLICHLPLIIPEQCGIRIGNHRLEWEPGKLIMFDDSVEHEAWNNSNQTRIILLFEVWKPEISLEERAELTTLFEVFSESRS